MHHLLGRPDLCLSLVAYRDRGDAFQGALNQLQAGGGLDKQGETIQRQMAQYTGGKFVFLTYAQAHNPASGPGRETVHDVQNYGVDTLDRLIVRLVREDLAKLGRSGS